LLSSIYTNQKRKKLPSGVLDLCSRFELIQEPSNHTEDMEHSSGSHPHTNTHEGEPMILDTGSEVHANIDVPEDVHAGVVIKERGNKIIKPFDLNIDAMDEECLNTGKLTFVSFLKFFLYCIQ
jgi:hypothetical protein